MFLDLLLLLEKEASHRLTRSVQSSQCQTLYSKTLRGKFAGNRPLSRGGHFSVDLLRLCLHSTESSYRIGLLFAHLMMILAPFL